MRYSNIIIGFIVLVMGTALNAQETLDANDPNSFIFGGDQKSNIANIDLLPINLVDVETDPNNAISFGVNTIDLEAGQPVIGGNGSSVNETLWLNFTYRSQSFQNAVIYAKTNLPVPAGMQIFLQIINSAAGGDYPKNPRLDPIILSQTTQPIVYGFANGFTADGNNNGYQLQYTLENNGGASLPDGFEVIYEIIEQ